MEIVLAIVSAFCCLSLPVMLLSLPLGVFAVRRARLAPDRRTLLAMLAAVANALLCGIALGAVGFGFGASIGDDSAGDAASALLAFGCVGGAPLAFVITLVGVHRLGRGPASTSSRVDSGVPFPESIPVPNGSAPMPPRPPAPLPPGVDPDGGERRATRALGCAFAALVVGVATSLVGFVLSLTIGLFSLAFAQITVRPIAGVFVLVHLVTLALSLRARARATDSLRNRALFGACLSALGVVLATLIAAFGPSFFEWLMDGAVDLMLA